MAMCSEIASSTLKRDILPPGVHTLTSTPPVGVKSAAWSSSSMAKVASLTWMHPGGGMGGGGCFADSDAPWRGGREGRGGKGKVRRGAWRGRRGRQGGRGGSGGGGGGDSGSGLFPGRYTQLSEVIT